MIDVDMIVVFDMILQTWYVYIIFVSDDFFIQGHQRPLRMHLNNHIILYTSMLQPVDYYTHMFYLTILILISCALAVVVEMFGQQPCIPVTAFMKEIIGETAKTRVCQVADPLGADDKSVTYEPPKCMVSEWKSDGVCDAECNEMSTQKFTRDILKYGDDCRDYKLEEVRSCVGACVKK